MSSKPVDPNAKEALNQMKLEISNELGINNSTNGANDTSFKNGELGGRVGGQMSRRLVEMGKEALLRQYNSKK
ncbi:alpha/beta-type small acid-soluble spore protein [Romboutsia sp. 1001713B170207_170306_H8]|uniref:alpha/beta-type small acid-soluble spore protein n=1 Tax=Romboutsia sp. 1001713B170207_170306_H8 TaxID=2787112 RepID=UPI00082070F9|nr:alpha/beta-type small acid-soluble spore protein [Romboutsia sp. 1001713B170207_170306_H8]SCH89213.1 Small%2C acid-soluble spore protein beta [uncultured Clostridium sp.]